MREPVKEKTNKWARESADTAKDGTTVVGASPQLRFFGKVTSLRDSSYILCISRNLLRAEATWSYVKGNKRKV